MDEQPYKKGLYRRLNAASRNATETDANEPSTLDATASGSRLAADLNHRLFESFSKSEIPDITIVCGSRRLHVHRFQLATHSKVFNAMLNGPFRESSAKEIPLPDDEPTIMERVFLYMYTFSYKPSFNGIDPNPLLFPNPLVFHLHVANVADKYDIRNLKQLALEAFKSRALDDDYTKRLTKVIRAAYEGEEFEPYRKLIIELVNTKMRAYQESKEKYESSWKVVEGIPAFAVDVLRGGTECGSKAKKRGFYVAEEESPSKSKSKRARSE